MAITMEDGLTDVLYEPGVEPGFSVRADVALRDQVASALRTAIRRIFAEVPHPDEPDVGPYASFASPVAEGPAGCFSFWLDLADLEAYRDTGVVEHIVEILVEELQAAGADPSTVGPYARPDPPPPRREPRPDAIEPRYRFDGILPAGLPEELVDAFSDPAFGLSRPDGQHVQAEAWSIELRVDGTPQDVSAMADALERSGVSVRVIRPRHVAYQGFGQRGEIAVRGSAVLTGQDDEPHPELAEIDHPEGSQPILARRLSNPTRVEMSLWCPGPPASTLARYERRLRLRGFELDQADHDDESDVPRAQLRLQRPESTVTVMAQELPDRSSYAWVTFRRTEWPDY